MKPQNAQKQQAKKPVKKKCTNSACRKHFLVNESCTCPFCGKFYPRLKNVPIEDLDFTVRTYNCLKHSGINTLTDITAKSEEEMMHVRNLGRRSRGEIIEKIGQLGFSLRKSN